MTDQPNRAAIQDAIRTKYGRVARSAQGVFNYATGAQGARDLGYGSDLVAGAPARLLESFCGVGNPFALGPIVAGEDVLDIGCGAGFDLYVASDMVGASGRVYGVDLTPEMVSTATANMASSGRTNVEVREGSSEDLPHEQGSMNVVLSNGVLNLSPLKNESLREAFRVLKPGGRLQFADIVLDGDSPRETVGSLEAWSDWIGGAIPVRDLIQLIQDAGFIDVEHVGKTGVSTSPRTVGAAFRARKPG